MNSRQVKLAADVSRCAPIENVCTKAQTCARFKQLGRVYTDFSKAISPGGQCDSYIKDRDNGQE